jgi:hypothetical protein
MITITNYIDLICKFPALDIPQNLSDVYIPEHKSITLYRNYRAVELFMNAEVVPYDMLELANAVHPGNYTVCPWGNQGFKTSYIRVYEDYQQHHVYGEYVAWAVHI